MTLDLRPTNLQGPVRFRPGQPYTFRIRVTDPADWLDDYTFTATLGGLDLDVTEDGTDLIITASEADTTALAEPEWSRFLLIEDTYGVVVAERFEPDLNGTVAPGSTISLNLAPIEITATLVVGPASAGGGGGVSDHGDLTGLADDDHAQYLNNARGDARYWPLATDLATQLELNAEATLARNADNLTSGTVNDARLPAGIARDAEVTSLITAEQVARDAAIAVAIGNLIASAPGLLDTLDEIAAALGDDPNFATTITTALAGKQTSHANLTALAGLAGLADRLPYFTGAGAMSMATFTAFARSILDDADATAARATLGLVLGTDIYSKAAVDGLIAGLSGTYVPLARTLTAGDGIDGGGDLSANRTFDVDSTVARLTAVQTLTNKTLTAPVVNSPTGIVKGDVGLGNVDNTSDANKPVSTATQTALDLKANLASPALTGNPTAPTAAQGDNDTSIATTAFVNAEIAADAQPLDADLTAIAALTTTAFGRALLELANAGALRTAAALGSMATETASDYVAKALYDANTILIATSDNTPLAMTVAASRIVGRKATGDIDDMTTAELAALFGTPTGSKFLADDGTLKTAGGAVATDALWDAAGDLAVGTGPDTAARLAKGTQGFGLVAGTTTVAWERLSSVVDHSATAQTFNTSTADNTIASLTLPAGAVAAGDLVRLTVLVSALNNSGANVTFRFRGKVGATTVCDTGTVSVSSNSTRAEGRIAFEVVVESTTAERAVLHGHLVRGAVVTNAAGGFVFGDYGTATEDTSSSKTFVLSCEMGTSSATAEITGFASTLEVIKKR